jgi:hypothetical protein
MDILIVRGNSMNMRCGTVPIPRYFGLVRRSSREVQDVARAIHPDRERTADHSRRRPVAAAAAAEPGKSDDVTPELLPCNICVADSRQNKYDPFKVFQVDARKPGLPASVCEWEQNAGCYDMCSWNGSNWIHVEQSAVDVVGKQCGLPKPPVIK